MGGRQDLGSDFYAYISNKSSGNVLTNDGDNVSAKTKQYTNNQKWHFIRQSDGSYQIQSVWDKGKYLDAYSRKGRSGDNLQVYGSEGESPQQWNLYTAGSNVYYIMPSYSKSAVIDIADGSTSSGANVQIWAYNQTAAKKFEIQKIGSPEVKVSTHSINLDLCGTNSATISVIADGIFSVPCKLGCSRDTNVMSTSWGEKTGNIASLNVSGIKTGAYSISVLIINSETGDTLSSDNITVNIICSHKYSDWSTTKSSTCTVDGYKTRKCSVCGHTETQTLKALGHSYTTSTVKPTCTSQGYTVHTCSRCSNGYKDSYISATGHSFGSWTTTKSPTCTTEGTKQRKCSSCGKTETQTIPATGHSYTTTVKEPTYTEQGYTLHTCSKCGHSYKSDIKPMLVEKLVNSSTVSGTKITLGDKLTVNAKASGGTGGYTYAVWYKLTTASTWTRVQNYNTNISVSFTPVKEGSYDVSVKVKDSSGTIVKKAFTVDVFAPLKNTTTVSSTSIGYGGTFTVKAKATGGLGDYTYAVYYKKASATKWTTAQNYSSTKTVTIKPKYAEEYDVSVKVKDSRGVVAKKTFKIKVTKPTNTSKVASTTITLGNTIDITCSATGGSGFYQYAVYYKKSSDTSWKTKLFI